MALPTIKNLGVLGPSVLAKLLPVLTPKAQLLWELTARVTGSSVRYYPLTALDKSPAPLT